MPFKHSLTSHTFLIFISFFFPCLFIKLNLYSVSQLDGVSVTYNNNFAELAFGDCMSSFEGQYECRATNEIHGENYTTSESLEFNVYGSFCL